MNKSRQLRQGGFSFIEIMVVVVIITIIGAIAWPSYIEYVQRSRRAEAKALMMEAAQCMERFNTSNQTYVGGPARCPITASEFYALNYANVAAGTFSITAAPQDTQTTDYCGQLGLNQSGVKTDGGTPADQCW